jgi:predicted PurR-regulated permease PerM
VIDRAEGTGIHRPLAALILVLLLIVGVVGPLLIMLPALADELRHFLDDLPHAVARVQAILWTGLHRISGDEVRIEESVGSEVRTIGSAWLDDAIHSAVSCGTALFSLLSLLVVVPVVTVYLLVDWNRMAATEANEKGTRALLAPLPNGGIVSSFRRTCATRSDWEATFAAILHGAVAP